MAVTQSEIEAQIVAIDLKLTGGVTRVSYEGKGSTEYDLASLRKRRAELIAQLSSFTTTSPRIRQLRIYSGKDL